MATEYELKLRAELDTQRVQQNLQGLGHVGVQSTNDLVESVKRLDNAIQDVTRSWKEQAQAQARAIAEQSVTMKRVGRMMAGRFVGGALLKQAGQAAGGGDELGALGYGMAGGALKGAAAGAFFGAPGMVLGAGVGMLEEGLANLAKAAEKAAEEITKAAAAQASQNKAWHKAQNEQVLNDRIDAVQYETNAQLERRIADAQKAEEELADFLRPGSESSKKFANDFRELGFDAGIDFIGFRDKRMKELQKAADEAGKLADAARSELKTRGRWTDPNEAVREQERMDREELQRRQKEADARAKEQERLAKEQETRSRKAVEDLESFNRKKSFEDFALGVQNMNPGEVRDTIKALRYQQGQLESQYAQAKSDVAATGSAEMAERADAIKEQMDSNGRKLDAAENALNSLYGGPSLDSLFKGTVSDMARKGYDKGGYDSVENALMRSQVEATKQVKQDTGKIADAVSKVTEYVQEIKNMQQNGEAAGATYG